MAEEKAFENKVKQWLQDEGIYPAGIPKNKIKAPVVGWYFKVWGGGYQKAGIPDLIINVNGFFIGCELKADTGKASELQKKNITLINQGNGIGIILYPKGFEQFKTIVKGVKGCNSHIPGLNALKTANTSTSCIILMG